MVLKQTVVNNSGMSQDLSVDKQDNKFAFENRNIRIQATDDGTLLSVTNLKNPKAVTDEIQCDKVLGHCVTPDYVVIFGIRRGNDVIYRINLDAIESGEGAAYNTLFYGSELGFTASTDSYFDTLYYEEGEKVKKVYWTDNVHSPRVINLITPVERIGGTLAKEDSGYDSNVFEFYPNMYRTSTSDGELIPEIQVEKNRTVPSALPAGVVQYFVSYYWENGAETLIANSSDLYTIDYSTRGGKADETGFCAFDIKIPSNTVNHEFDYMRVYSAIRTTYNGPLIVKIVGDIKLYKGATNAGRPQYYTLLDDGMMQEQLQDSTLFFIGGSPFVAKTLVDKDETLFFGNVKQENPNLDENFEKAIATALGEYHTDDPVMWAKDIDGANGGLEFTLNKKLPLYPNQFNSFYNYKLQTNNGARTYRTFKSGEIYRFGIQFQDNRGAWSEVCWIGDKECVERPTFDEAENAFVVNDVHFKLPESIKEGAQRLGFVNYRIVIADTENTNARKIKAQGILSPTLFTPGQRALNAPYILPSWSMRPRKGKAAYHHMEPLFSAEVDGAELASYTPDFSNPKNLREYSSPFYYSEDNRQKYVVTFIGCSPGSEMWIRSVLVTSDNMANNFYDSEGNQPSTKDYVVLCDYIYDGGGASNSKYADGISGDFNNKKFKFLYSANTDPGAGEIILSKDGNASSFYNIVKAFEDAGIDQRLIPDPDTFVSWGKDLVKQYALEVVTAVFTVLEGGITWLISATAGAGVIDDARTKVENGSAPPSSLLYTTAGVSIAASGLTSGIFQAVMGGIAERTSPKQTNLTDSDFVALLGSEEYDKLADYQKTLWKKRCMPLYTTHAASKPYASNLQKAPLGVTTYKNLNNIVFSSTKKNYKIENKLQVTLPEIFRPETLDSLSSPKGTSGNASGYWDQLSVYMQVIPVATNTAFNREVNNKYYDYFVDESWVTFNSPELEDTKVTSEDLNLRIVGTIPYSNSYSDIKTKVNATAAKAAGTNYSRIQNYKNADAFNPFYSDYLYYEYGWAAYTPGEDDEGYHATAILTPAVTSSWYKMFLFSPDNYLGANDLTEVEDLKMSVVPGKVEKQQIISHKFSNATNYNPYNEEDKNYTDDCSYEKLEYSQIFGDNDSAFIRDSGNYLSYFNNYDNLIVNSELPHFHVEINKNMEYPDSEATAHVSPGNVRLKFSTTPHILLNLNNKDKLGERFLLPRFTGATREKTHQDIIYTVFTNLNKAKWTEHVQNYYTPDTPPDFTVSSKEWPANYTSIKEETDSTELERIQYVQGYIAGESDVTAGVPSGTTSSPYIAASPEDVNWEDGYTDGYAETAITDENLLKYYNMQAIQVIANTELKSVPDTDTPPDVTDVQYFIVEALNEDTSDYYFTALDRKVKVWENDSYRGEWAQNNYEDYNEVGVPISVWQNGLPYHCGDYFTAVVNNGSPTDYVSILDSKLKGSSPFYSMVLDVARKNNKIDDEGKWIPSTFDSGNKVTLSFVDPTYGIEQAVIIGTYILNDTSIPADNLYENCEQKKARVKTITLQMVQNPEDVTTWYPDSVIAPCDCDENFLSTDETRTDNDIYLNELDSTGTRIQFRTYSNSNPRKFVEPVTAYEFEPVKDFDIKYTHPKIYNTAPTSEYSFIGELYQDIEHKDLYGGYQEHALRQLSWHPISEITKLEDDVTTVEGDTYYQRWDCMKTYPTTEEDVNQYVDITSFMVESHINLDERTDVNRAIFNLMSRPTNFNLFNPVYNQLNNTFEYVTDWSDLSDSNLSNYVTWSSTKNLLGDVDSWTNINVSSSTRTKYPVTKLLSYNNQVMALTEHSLEIINFNKKNLIPTDDNSFIELQNSRKVDGTIALQYPYGSYNMSTLITEHGLYFIDDNEKSLIRLNGNGITKIGYTKLVDWLHNNIIQGTYTFDTGEPLHLEYDSVHKDVYLINKSTCLVYSESLNEFTSFIDYKGPYWLFNHSGKFYAIKANPSSLVTHEMFAGESYNQDFDGKTLEYSVHYVLNPNSYTDKVFTNGTITADCGVTGTDSPVLQPNSTKDDVELPFDTVRIWTEYQDTEKQPLVKLLDRPSNLKQKFRFWKFLIPRDAKAKVWPRNRIRNPWARIKLTGNSTKKMEFHNMTIQYME